MLGNVGPLQLGIIFLIVLIVFGPKSLPRVGQALGRGIREFKDAARGLTADLEDEERNRTEIPAKSQEQSRETPATPPSTNVIDSPTTKV